MLSHRCLRWLGDVTRMKDGIPKEIMIDQQEKNNWLPGRPLLWYKDVCKQDMELTGIVPKTRKTIVKYQENWRHVVKEGIMKDKHESKLRTKRGKQRWKNRFKNQLPNTSATHIVLIGWTVTTKHIKHIKIKNWPVGYGIFVSRVKGSLLHYLTLWSSLSYNMLLCSHLIYLFLSNVTIFV